MVPASSDRCPVPAGKLRPEVLCRGPYRMKASTRIEQSLPTIDIRGSVDLREELELDRTKFALAIA